jgi:hypothetical protein
LRKLLSAAIIVVFCTAAGIFAYRYAHPNAIQKSAAASQPASSSGITSSAEPSGSPKSETERSEGAKILSYGSASDASSKELSDTDRIKASVDLDWNRYVLKASEAKVLQGKTYSTFDIWDEDYIVGPRILVDQSTKNIYTWAPNDDSPVPAAEDKAFDKTPHSIIGTVKDGANMSVTLTTANGDITVRRLGIDTTKLSSLKIGDRIKVTYTGIINGTDTTRAFITKLETVS